MIDAVHSRMSKHQESINAVKDMINILEKRQKDWLMELNDYGKNIQQFVKFVTFLIMTKNQW